MRAFRRRGRHPVEARLNAPLACLLLVARRLTEARNLW
jgi:hypothetical protein